MRKASEAVRAWVASRGEGAEFSVADAVSATGVSRDTALRALRGMVAAGALLAELRKYNNHINQTIYIKPIMLPGGYIAEYQGTDIMVMDSGVVMTQSANELNTAIITTPVTVVQDAAGYMRASGLAWRVASSDEVYSWNEAAGLINFGGGENG